MSQKHAPGYPLPDGDLGDDDIVCQLVYLPDRAEYWQALLGAISYMATWRAWERDSDKRGKDAAANWREAFELTMRCWRMTCLEQLQSDVSSILALMRNSDPCCGDTITYGDSTAYITIIIPGDGDPPEFYGETPVEDWDEWKQYLCHNAHLWVDELIRAAGTVEVALSTGGMSIALLAAIIAAIAFFVVGGVIALPLLMLILFGLGTEVSATIFATAATDIESSRENIVCAIMKGLSVSTAVETALSSGTAWDLLYNFIDYDSSVAILYEGGDGDTVYLESETRDDCTCTEGYELVVLPAPKGTIVDQSHYSPLLHLSCWWCAQLRVQVEGDPGNYVAFRIVSMESISGQCLTDDIYSVWDFPGESKIYGSSTPPSNLPNCKYIVVLGGNDFGSKEIIWTVD